MFGGILTWLVSAALFCMASAAIAQDARVERIDILKTGIMKMEGELKRNPDATISTGERLAAKKLRIVEATSVVPAKVDTAFGVEIRIVGKPAGRKARLKIVWLYPQPGLKNPDTGTAKMRDEYEDEQILDTTTSYFWQLGSSWALVPGKWTLEIWQGDRRLAKHDFALVP